MEERINTLQSQITKFQEELLQMLRKQREQLTQSFNSRMAE